MRTTKINLAILTVLLMGAGVFLAGWTFLWVSRGSFLTAVITISAAAYAFGFSFHMGYVLWGDPHPRVEHGAEGTVVRPQKFVDRMFFMSFLSATSASVLYLALSPFDMVELRLPEGFRRADLAICAFFIAFNVPTLYRALKHGGESHLRLNREGFEVWNGFWGSFVRGEWDDVKQIVDHPVRGRKLPREVIVFVRPKHRTAMLMADEITRDDEALLDWVRFYWRHPECREELLDCRASRRLHGAGDEFVD